MNTYHAGDWDIAVVGAGHAGIEGLWLLPA